jgi:hypothetical protein
MAKPMILEFNAETQIETVREMTDTEFAQWETDNAAWEADKAARNAE